MDKPKPDEDIQQWIDALHERQKYHDRQGKAKDQAKQRSIQGLSSPLPRRTMPRPWEDLASVIGRTAQAMGYSQPGWILRPEKIGHSIPSEALPLLKWQLDYELLGRLLDLDESTLHGLTLHRFAARVSSRSAAIPTETTGMQRFPRLNELPRLWNAQRLFAYSGRTIQVCPRCFDEPDGGYDRLYWRTAPVLLCPRHRVWLIDACPTCQKPIPALRPKLSTCPTCGGDYRQKVLPLAPQASWLHSTHRVFFTHLGLDATELGEPFPEEEPSPLQDLASHEYLWIVTQFLELLLSQPYRERLLPFLLRTLPIGDLEPSPTQGSSTICSRAGRSTSGSCLSVSNRRWRRTTCGSTLHMHQPRSGKHNSHLETSGLREPPGSKLWHFFKCFSTR